MRSSKSPAKRKRGKQSKEPIRSKVYLHIKLSAVLAFSARSIFQHPIIKSVRLALKFALILIVYWLLDQPAVVIPENIFIVDVERTPHMMLNLKRQFDESLVSRIYPCL